MDVIAGLFHWTFLLPALASEMPYRMEHELPPVEASDDNSDKA